MEYALEGHGYCWSRALRSRPSYRSQPTAARPALDAQIDDLAQARAGTGISADGVEAPAELLASLHVRAPSSPRAALALQVATSVRSVFDGLAVAAPLSVTHCTFEAGPTDGAAGEPHLVLGAWFPSLSAEVARGDSVAAGLVIALHGDPGDGSARIDVLSRVFRKVCENGAMIHELDQPAVQIEVHRVGNGLRDALAQRVAGVLDPALFVRCVEALQASAADPLDHRGGPLGALLRHALPYDTWQAVMGRYAGDAWTRWGLANAVTAEARWSPTFAEASRLERIGGFLARSPWRAYAELPPALLDPPGSAAAIEETGAEKVSAG
jgi:hypothetical protein